MSSSDFLFKATLLEMQDILFQLQEEDDIACPPDQEKLGNFPLE
jgi:hypothetical protein